MSPTDTTNYFCNWFNSGVRYYITLVTLSIKLKREKNLRVSIVLTTTLQHSTNTSHPAHPHYSNPHNHAQQDSENSCMSWSWAATQRGSGVEAAQVTLRGTRHSLFGTLASTVRCAGVLQQLISLMVLSSEHEKGPAEAISSRCGGPSLCCSCCSYASS